MASKIDIREIVSNHFKTLVNQATQKMGIDDWTWFVIAPLVGGILSYCLSFRIDPENDSIDTIVTILSILTGLLLNLLVILFDISSKERHIKIEQELKKETITNISYSILLSLVMIPISLMILIDSFAFQRILTAIIISLSIHYSFTLLMILKRIDKLFNRN